MAICMHSYANFLFISFAHFSHQIIQKLYFSNININSNNNNYDIYLKNPRQLLMEITLNIMINLEELKSLQYLVNPCRNIIFVSICQRTHIFILFIPPIQKYYICFHLPKSSFLSFAMLYCTLHRDQTHSCLAQSILYIPIFLLILYFSMRFLLQEDYKFLMLIM